MKLIERIIKKYFVALVIPIFAIVVPAYFGREQNFIQKEFNPPVFFLEQVNRENKLPMIKVTNEGGWATYFKFRRITEIWITFDNIVSSLEIYYLDENNLSTSNANKENKKIWYYIPNIDLSSSEIETIVSEKINSLSMKKYNLFYQIQDYYELSYYDSKNEYYKLYYTIDKNGIGQYEEKKDFYHEYEKHGTFGGMSATGLISREDFIGILEESVAEMILQYRWYGGMKS